MKIDVRQIVLTVVLSLGMITFAYALDRVGSGTPESDTTAPAAKKKGDRQRPAETSGSGATEKSAEGGKDLSTPSKMDSGAPGTPGGASPGTSSTTETAPKTGTGR